MKDPSILSVGAVLRHIVLAVWFVGLLASPAAANVGYGVLANESATYVFGPSGHHVVFSDQFSTPTWLPVTGYAAPSIGSSDSITYSAGGIIYTDSASTAVNTLVAQNGMLHNWTSSYGVTDNPLAESYAYADASVSWRDVLTVGGLPQGTPVQLLITDYLYSQVSANRVFGSGTTSAAAYYNFQLYGQIGEHVDLQLNNLATDPHLLLKETYLTYGYVGTPLTLLLQMQTDAQGNGGVWFANANAGNTAFANIQVVTPGATLSSESSIDYSRLSETPEPSSILLFASGCLGLAGILKRRLAA